MAKPHGNIVPVTVSCYLTKVDFRLATKPRMFTYGHLNLKSAYSCPNAVSAMMDLFCTLQFSRAVNNWPDPHVL